MRVVAYVGSDRTRFKELMNCFFKGEYRLAQRAAWPVSYCVEAHPDLIKPYYKQLIEKLSDPTVPEAVPRNSIRLLQDVDIPEKWEGPIMDYCFKAISSPSIAIAIKAFSLRVLENLSARYPEILPELKLIIEERWDQETPAFKSRAKKILKAIEKRGTGK